jgi:hypothetical protein
MQGEAGWSRRDGGGPAGHGTAAARNPAEILLRRPERPIYGRLVAFIMNMVRHVRHRAVAAGMGVAPAH